ncbi:MAG: hypothetical protein R2704_16550 [Microthrixaceae bacterium]
MPRLADASGWQHGSLVTPPTPPAPSSVGEDPSIAALLGAAEDIVNEAGPRIRTEVDADRKRAAKQKRWKFWKRAERTRRRSHRFADGAPPPGDGTPVGGWLMKAAPGVWDLEAQLRAGRRADVVAVGPHLPCRPDSGRGSRRCSWRTRGWSGPSRHRGGGPGHRSRPGTNGRGPRGPPWVSASARDRPRPRVDLAAEVLDQPLALERTDAVPELRNIEVRRVPRDRQSVVITPAQWSRLKNFFGNP